MGGLIRTIGGDLPADLIGPTYVHEHLIIDSQLVAESMPHIHLASEDDAVAEMSQCVAAGVRTVVDAMPAAAGRDPERLTRISVRTGVRVVAATGLHTAKYYEAMPWTREESPDQLAQRFVADVEEGIDRHDYRGEAIERTEARAGIVKVAALTETLTARDRRLFEAAAITHTQTGVPVLTHTEAGRGGMGQIEELVRLGVAPGRIALSHTDKVGDRGYHLDMVETGVSLCYDQGLRQPEETFTLLEEMIGAGHIERLVLGTDGARRSLWSTLGGAPGLADLYRSASARLDPGHLRTLFVENPARYLSLGT